MDTHKIIITVSEHLELMIMDQHVFMIILESVFNHDISWCMKGNRII